MHLPKNLGTCALALMIAGGLTTAAKAGVIVTITQVGGDVDVTATGTLNTTGATSVGSLGFYDPGLIPGGNNWWVAPGPGGGWQSYQLTSVSIPFGVSTTFFNSPSSLSGGTFFIWGASGGTPQVGVPTGYVSGGAINSAEVFTGQTIAGLTLTPGTYTFTIPNDTITLEIGQGTIPEPATLSLLGLSLAGLGFARRRKTN